MKRYPRIALTGSIASGKSTVSRMLKEKGAFIIDADEVARAVVEPGRPCWKRLYEAIGGQYFNADGSLKRKEIKDQIVKDKEFKKIVEEVTHPAIIEEMNNLWNDYLSTNPENPAIFDIPLLFEVGLEKNFDFVIVVWTPREIQIERLVKRDGITYEEANKLIGLQEDLEIKKAKASFVISNTTLSETAKQVDLLWDHLLKLWQEC